MNPETVASWMKVAAYAVIAAIVGYVIYQIYAAYRATADAVTSSIESVTTSVTEAYRSAVAGVVKAGETIVTFAQNDINPWSPNNIVYSSFDSDDGYITLGTRISDMIHLPPDPTEELTQEQLEANQGAVFGIYKPIRRR